MEHRAHERARQGLHGLVSPRTALRIAVRGVLTLAIATSLVAGIAGGLLRAGVAWPATVTWLPQAALAHAQLMVCAFLGSVIGVERAVAVKRRWAYATPLSAALSAVAVLSGAAAAAAWLQVAAALVFVAVNAVLLSRQQAAHTAWLLAAALAWLTGNTLHARDAAAAAVVPWWFAFLVLTIVAERLEMTRLMRRRRAAAPLLTLLLSALLLACVAGTLALPIAGMLYGAALTGLAAWLLAFDIARRTVRARGLPRYMAVCLLGGYAWLAVSGVAWWATSLGAPARDAALHALALGFVFCMVLAHAPVILPAVAGVKLQFGRVFYAPLAVLHGSLLMRLLLPVWDARGLALGAAANAAAIALFAVTVIAAALAWHRRNARAPSPR